VTAGILYNLWSFLDRGLIPPQIVKKCFKKYYHNTQILTKKIHSKYSHSSKKYTINIKYDRRGGEMHIILMKVNITNEKSESKQKKKHIKSIH